MEKIYVVADASVFIFIGIVLFCKKEQIIFSIIDQNRTKYLSSYGKLKIFILVVATVFLLGGIKMILFDFKNPNNFIRQNEVAK